MVINENQKNAFTQSVMGDSEGGGGIPPITEADEGKVLTVDDGEPVWAEGGGGSAFIANDVSGVLDKKAGELLEAYENGSQLFICANLGEGVTGYLNQAVITVAAYSYEDSGSTIEFYGFGIYSSEARGLLMYEAYSLDEYPMG